MFRSNHMKLGVAAAVVVAGLGAAAPGDDGGLLARVPSGANAVAVIDVDKLLKSPMGEREKWKEKLKNAYEAQPMIVPPNAARIVLASWIDPGSLTPIWETSIMELKTTPSMEKIAKAENGYLDTIAEKQAVWSPINAYFIRLDSRVLGTVAPANRQFTARWARRGPTAGELSPYLQSAVAAPGDDSYVFAMDLEDVTSPRKVRRRLEEESFASLDGKNIDVDKVGQLLASLKGLTLRVKVDDDATGIGVIEFGRPAAPLAGVAKPLLLEILDQCGAMVDDFNDWKVTVKGNTIALDGKLSADGLRKLFSIVDPPSPMAAGDGDDSKPAAPGDKPTDEKAVVAASKQYYAAVADIIDNVGKKIRNSASMTQGAAWVARDARRIDRLPILNVDPELVSWGTQVSTGLGNLAGVVGVGGLQARSRTVGIADAYTSGADSGWAGNVVGAQGINPNDSVDRRNVTRQRRAAAADEKAKTAQVAVQMFREIETSRAQVRAAMTQKYKVSF